MSVYVYNIGNEIESESKNMRASVHNFNVGYLIECAVWQTMFTK